MFLISGARVPRRTSVHIGEPVAQQRLIDRDRVLVPPEAAMRQGQAPPCIVGVQLADELRDGRVRADPDRQHVLEPSFEELRCRRGLTGAHERAVDRDRAADVLDALRRRDVLRRQRLEVVADALVRADPVAILELVVDVGADDRVQVIRVRRAIPPQQPALLEILQRDIELRVRTDDLLRGAPRGARGLGRARGLFLRFTATREPAPKRSFIELRPILVERDEPVIELGGPQGRRLCGWTHGPGRIAAKRVDRVDRRPVDRLAEDRDPAEQAPVSRVQPRQPGGEDVRPALLEVEVGKTQRPARRWVGEPTVKSPGSGR